MTQRTLEKRLPEKTNVIGTRSPNCSRNDEKCGGPAFNCTKQEACETLVNAKGLLRSGRAVFVRRRHSRRVRAHRLRVLWWQSREGDSA